MAKTVADVVMERLIHWGVDTIFGLPGDGVSGLFEALRTRQEQLRFVKVRHEEAAAFAACGSAQYTGRLGVCLATSGLGGIHLLNSLYDAKCDGHPVLAITGHRVHDLIGTRQQQDVDLAKLFIDVAAYNQRVMGATHAQNVIDEAACFQSYTSTAWSSSVHPAGLRRSLSVFFLQLNSRREKRLIGK